MYLIACSEGLNMYLRLKGVRIQIKPCKFACEMNNLLEANYQCMHQGTHTHGQIHSIYTMMYSSMFAVKLLTHHILNTQELSNIKHLHNTYLFKTISIGTPGYRTPTQNTSKDIKTNTTHWSLCTLTRATFSHSEPKSIDITASPSEVAQKRG